jgi:hypothetical protein
MATIIADILHHKAASNPFHKENNPTARQNSPPAPSRLCRTGYAHKHKTPRPEESFEIRTNFGLWVEKIQAKRTESYDVMG